MNYLIRAIHSYEAGNAAEGMAERSADIWKRNMYLSIEAARIERAKCEALLSIAESLKKIADATNKETTK